MKPYLAGPLYNEHERKELEDLSEFLLQYNHRCYVPHRDGFSFPELFTVVSRINGSNPRSTMITNYLINCHNLYNLWSCDSLLFNLNGRVPDEGGSVEAGIAYGWGYPIVLYQTDWRRFIKDQNCPSLEELTKFPVCDNKEKLSFCFRLISDRNKEDIETSFTKPAFENNYDLNMGLILDSARMYESIPIDTITAFINEPTFYSRFLIRETIDCFTKY